MSKADWLNTFYRILIVYIRRNVSSPMLFVSFFLLGVWRNFCRFWSWKKSHWKDVTGQRMIGIHFWGSWLLLVEMREWECSLRKSHWRVCVGPVSENVIGEWVLEDERIYRKFLSWSRLQKRRSKLKCRM